MGAEGVGKSSLTIKYIENNFMENYDPTIEDTYRKQVEVGGVVREVEILDTTGVEENRELRERLGFFFFYFFFFYFFFFFFF